MTPGSCSTGIHILLEEIDRPFEAYIVNLPAGDHYQPDYVAINPKSTIPTLVKDDGSALTEFQAIAWWLARSNPKAKLLPDGLDGEVRVLEVMDYTVGTIHMQGFARLFATDRFTPTAAAFEAVRTRGREIVAQGFAVIDDVLAGRPTVVDQFSIADAALFYVEFWADKLKIELPPHCHAHYQGMLQRDAVRRVLREEGYR
jgi:glutathione S-transferase